MAAMPLRAQDEPDAPDSAGAGLRFPIPQDGDAPQSPLYLGNPSNMTTTVEYDPSTHSYVRLTKVGSFVVSRQFLTFEEYQDYQMQQLMTDFWSQKLEENSLTGGEDGLLSKIPGFSEISRKLESLMDKPEIKITPSGSADLTLQVINNYTDNPSWDESQRSKTNFDFDENIQLTLNAKIGDLINTDINWNTQATFDFENQAKLKYEGKEDDILQLLEAADISFPLNTTLIKGSQRLFGVHTKLKFGNLTVDAVASQKETSTENMQVQGGSSSQEFEIRADEYEENRHYFISQYFYDNYNKAMSTLPVVNSNIKIIRLEVWRTNIGAAVTNNRDILALTDLGEHTTSSPGVYGGTSVLPNGQTSNNLLQLINANAVRNVDNVSSYMEGLGFTGGTDYEKLQSARLLPQNEYTFNAQLGFITLSQPLANDQILAVAFQYQVIGDTTVYQVGELTTDGVNDPNVLIVKLIKGTSVNSRSPLWKLMMKNVYFLKSTQISRDNFRLNVLYENPDGGVGIGYFTEGPFEATPLVEVFGLDRMDASQSYYYADGVFDWFDSAAFKGGTIQASTGRIFFPYVEPFGKDLRERLGDNALANRYCFDSLYTMTQTLAQQYADKNKFYLEGYYTSSVSGEIQLGYSVTQGSVSVTAGGMPLVENVDYTVDYTMGTVRIINESLLSSNTPISVSSENSSFSMMTKRMLGLHLNYEFDPEFNLGATFMNLREKPLTQKNNFGDEPTSNSIWGLDLNYRHDVPFITKFMDRLPGIQTKAPSTLTLQAEFAHFIPGMANTGSDDGKVTYIDDFEGAESNIDLKGYSFWHLASTPQDYKSSLSLFPETSPGTGLAYGFNRAKLAWYTVGRVFFDSNCPENIDENDRSHPYARQINQREVFPNKSIAAGDNTRIYELTMAFYPSEKGPYNYDVGPTAFSSGIDQNGLLNNPQSRWGGIMRELTYTDFETQNIETIEFWLMDPFIDPATGEHDDSKSGGRLYINLGDISEDILRDGRKSFENGLPTANTAQAFVDNPVDTTIWGRVPKLQSVVNAFDNNESSRHFQDVGYDGLGSAVDLNDEQTFFADYINAIGALHGTSSQAYLQALEDPSSDDFRYFRSSYYDQNDVKINDRYKRYNNPEGNSVSNADNTESYSTEGSSQPNVEDINRDNTLSESENYYQYVINLTPDQMVIGKNHIVDIQEAQNVELANGTTTTCRWYQFRIPIREPDQTIGNINGYQSIRFMRMFLNGFEEPIILRFATLELVYGTWRKYSEDLLQPGDYPTGMGENTSFTLSTVNIEENGSRQPVPYNLPPNIERESWYSTSSSYTELNEQALELDISELNAGDARAVYRNAQYDLRYYGKLKMFVHAEKKYEADNLYDGDLTLFVRLGSDYTNNYYEYELPLTLTPWGTSADSKEIIWPQANQVEIDLQKLVEIKTNRNKLIRSGNLEYSSQMLYSELVDGRRYTIMGTPNLGKVKVIMVGVRNPRKQTLDDGNDMLPKSAIVWINEMRLSDYINRGGWAAMALARTNLADVGNLSLYSAYTTSGFGNLEDKLNKIELVNTFNVQSTLNLEMGKFLPDEWGMHIPLYLDYSNQIGSPEYNPLDPDVKLKDDLKTYQTMAERDSVKRMTQQRHQTTNLTLTNIRKERTGKSALKPHFYDIENFSFSYAYSGERSSDDDIEYYNKDQHRGGFSYNFAVNQPKQFKPFDKMKPFQNKNLKFIKDFNLFYQPKNVSFNTEVYRDIESTLLRNKSAALVIMNPSYFKQFTWRRDYNIQYDLARSFHITYDAVANARIDEPPGEIDRTASDTIWNALMRGGTMQNFQQNINISWDLPIGKLPYMDFLRTPLSYRTNYAYNGTTQALAAQGSVISNATTLNLAAQGNMQTLYNKFKLIKKAYAKKPAKATETSKKGKDADKDRNELDKKRGLEQRKADAAVADSLKRLQREEMLRELGYFGLRMVTGVKTFNLQYNNSFGATIAGFMGESRIIGLDPSNHWQPGLPFVLGLPESNPFTLATSDAATSSTVESLLRDDLLSHDTLMNTPSNANQNRQLTFQATVEPIRDLRIDLSAMQTYATHQEYYYKYSNASGRVEGPLSSTTTGNYTTSALALRTLFRSSDDLFAQFLDARGTVASSLAALNPDPYCDQMVQDTVNGQWYPAGYGANQQTVLLTSFLATYLGKDPASHSFSPFLSMPLPNWSLSYNGLSKIDFFKKWFSNISIQHKYSSTYTIGNFYTDAAISSVLEGYDYGAESIVNSNGDYIAPVSMEGVIIDERFQPLIMLSVNMVNSFQFKLGIQKSRSLNLSFSNNQLTETYRDGVTFGTGYTFKDVEFHVKAGDKTHNLKSDLVLQANLTYNNNFTQIRKINRMSRQITSGSKIWMVEFRAEYALSTALTLRLFFQTNINRPYITNAYPNSTTKGGITVHFSF